MDLENKKRIPPGQFLTDKFPVLTYGTTPVIKSEEWELKLFGEVESAVTINFAEFMQLPQIEIVADFHCVTTWSKLDNCWTGVHISEIFKLIQLKTEVKWVLIHSYGGYTTNLPLSVLDDSDVLLAHAHNQEPLTIDHGAPVRLIVPKKYAWKSAKWLSGIEFLVEDKLGFWEENGYSNNAEPFLETRYSVGHNEYDWDVHQKEIEYRKGLNL